MTKKTKPVFVVDLTEIENSDDIRFEFTNAKVRAGIPISESEAENLVRYGSKLTIACIDASIDDLLSQYKITRISDEDATKIVKYMHKVVTKKEPWYKRVWNWFKKPFTKKNEGNR